MVEILMWFKVLVSHDLKKKQTNYYSLFYIQKNRHADFDLTVDVTYSK